MSDDVFRWVIAVGVFLAAAGAVFQAVILASLYRAGKKAADVGKEAQGKFGPLVDRFDNLLNLSGKILEENRSRIAEITADLTVIAKTTRVQAEKVSEAMDEANARVKARIAQIDQTVDQTVQEVEHARDVVKETLLKPVKEVNGVVAGFKAALTTYAQGGNRNSPEHVTQDEEMFI